MGSIGEAEALPNLELARQHIGDEYANASQGYVHPIEAEGLYNYFGVPLEAIDRAIAEIRARSTV